MSARTSSIEGQSRTCQTLRPLPDQRLDTARRERVRVSPGSLVTVHRNYYSVHSRLIGEMVEVRVLPDTVEIWYADRKVEELPRLRGRGKHRVDYRHIILAGEKTGCV